MCVHMYLFVHLHTQVKPHVFSASIYTKMQARSVRRGLEFACAHWVHSLVRRPKVMTGGAPPETVSRAANKNLTDFCYVCRRLRARCLRRSAPASWVAFVFFWFRASLPNEPSNGCALGFSDLVQIRFVTRSRCREQLLRTFGG